MPVDIKPPKQMDDIKIRTAIIADIASVERLDFNITGISKLDYWTGIFEIYGKQKHGFFLVAECDGHVIGFIIGEVRAWEFGSSPCGWIFALGTDLNYRLKRIGSKLFSAMCDCLEEAGVDTVRTMLARSDELNMAFFRSQGMIGGSFIQLEMPLAGRDEE